MPFEIHWQIAARDGRIPWEPALRREGDLEYLKSVTVAVDRLGYAGALVATGYIDPWVLSAAVAPFSSRSRFLVANYPGLVSPTLLAQKAVSFERLFGPRLLINAVNGEDEAMRRQGSFLSKDDRYALAAEYWGLFRRLTGGETVDHEGGFFRLAGATAVGDHRGRRGPVPVWFSGSSPAALEVAAEHGDAYLSWLEPFAAIAAKMADFRERAARRGRAPRLGLRIPVIARETEDEAWAAADAILAGTAPATVEARRRKLEAFSEGGGQSAGMQRVFSALEGRVAAKARDQEIAPNLWAGLVLLDASAPAALVGDYAGVAARICELERLGIGILILSGFPRLEEAYRLSENLLPLLSRSAQAA